MQSLNHSLYQKTLLKILKLIPPYQPDQLCLADFPFAFPTIIIAQVYNIVTDNAEETVPLVAPLTLPISNAWVPPTLPEYIWGVCREDTESSR